MKSERPLIKFLHVSPQKDAEGKVRTVFDIPIFTEEFLNHSKGQQLTQKLGAAGRSTRQALSLCVCVSGSARGGDAPAA